VYHRRGENLTASARRESPDQYGQARDTNILQVDAFCVLRPCRIHLQRGDVAGTALDLKMCQTGALVVDAPPHHVIVAVEIPITNDLSRIRISCRLDQVVVDLNHTGRAPLIS